MRTTNPNCGYGYLRGAHSIIPGFTGTAPRRCQYIKGEPSADDACKCLKPAVPGKPYCAEHQALCVTVYTPPARKAEAA